MSTETKKKHPGGRPTDYRPDYHVQAVDDYITSCRDTDDMKVTMESDKTGTTAYQFSTKVKLPSIAGLSIYLGVARSTIWEWKEKYPEFSSALEKLLSHQEARLLDNGLGGQYTSTITKLILSNNHGYKEKTENAHTITAVNMAMDWGDTQDEP